MSIYCISMKIHLQNDEDMTELHITNFRTEVWLDEASYVYQGSTSTSIDSIKDLKNKQVWMWFVDVDTLILPLVFL
jgi:hypothetical protein